MRSGVGRHVRVHIEGGGSIEGRAGDAPLEPRRPSATITTQLGKRCEKPEGETSVLSTSCLFLFLLNLNILGPMARRLLTDEDYVCKPNMRAVVPLRLLCFAFRFLRRCFLFIIILTIASPVRVQIPLTTFRVAN